AARLVSHPFPTRRSSDLAAVCKLGRRAAADVRPQEVVDRLLAERAQDRELQRLRHERQSEVEVEDVGAREQLGERGPLRELPPRSEEHTSELQSRVDLVC